MRGDVVASWKQSSMSVNFSTFLDWNQYSYWCVVQNFLCLFSWASLMFKIEAAFRGEPNSWTTSLQITWFLFYITIQKNTSTIMAKSNNHRSTTKGGVTKANIGKNNKMETSYRDPSLLSCAVVSGKCVKSPLSSSTLATPLSSKIAATAASRLSLKINVILCSTIAAQSSSKDIPKCSPSLKKPVSKTPQRKINFADTVVPQSTKQLEVKLPPEQIDFFDFTITKHECFKYLKSNEELPRTQEDQLHFLFNQFSFSDLKTTFTIATTTLDKNAMKVYYPIPNTKKKLMTSFLGADVSKNTYRWVMIINILF